MTDLCTWTPFVNPGRSVPVANGKGSCQRRHVCPSLTIVQKCVCLRNLPTTAKINITCHKNVNSNQRNSFLSSRQRRSRLERLPFCLFLCSLFIDYFSFFLLSSLCLCVFCLPSVFCFHFLSFFSRYLLFFIALPSYVSSSFSAPFLVSVFSVFLYICFYFLIWLITLANVFVEWLVLLMCSQEVPIQFSVGRPAVLTEGSS